MYIDPVELDCINYYKNLDKKESEEERMETAALCYASSIPFEDAFDILNEDGARVLHAIRKGDYLLARELTEEIAYNAAKYHFMDKPFLVDEFLDDDYQ